jgi:hypothetical protein
LASAEDLTAALRVDVASEIGVQFVYIRIIWFAVWIIFPVKNYPFAVGRGEHPSGDRCGRSRSTKLTHTSRT